MDDLPRLNRQDRFKMDYDEAKILLSRDGWESKYAIVSAIRRFDSAVGVVLINYLIGRETVNLPLGWYEKAPHMLQNDRLGLRLEIYTGRQVGSIIAFKEYFKLSRLVKGEPGFLFKFKSAVSLPKSPKTKTYLITGYGKDVGEAFKSLGFITPDVRNLEYFASTDPHPDLWEVVKPT